MRLAFTTVGSCVLAALRARAQHIPETAISSCSIRGSEKITKLVQSQSDLKPFNSLNPDRQIGRIFQRG